MKITSRGQVTIPRDIRKKAGLLPNTEVEFAYLRGLVTLTPVFDAKREGHSIVEALRGSAGRAPKRMTTDVLMKLTRDA